MSLLNDRSIRDLSLRHTPPMISPFSEGVQGGSVISYGLSHAGYDLRLGGELLIFKASYGELIDPKRFSNEEYRKRIFDTVPASQGPLHISEWGYFIIPPHSYALGVSLEHLHIPDYIKGRCVGKSTLARCGILINTTPLEPGWYGHLTIEISNITPCPALVYAGEGIAQLEFEMLNSPPEKHYGDKSGKYQNQGANPVPARVKE